MEDKKAIDKYTPPQPDSKDTAHLVVKAALSFVPGASDLFEYFVVPPMQKRLGKWREEISQALLYLLENQGVKLDDLQGNEQFVTIVAQATSIAIRNHQKEKLEALKNVIVNSVTSPEIEEDLQLTFIRFVDELTPSHLYLLRLFINNKVEIECLKSYLSIYQLVSAKASNIPSKDQFKMLVSDLNVRGLIYVSRDIGDFEDIYQASSLLLESTNDNLPRIIITDIAKMFMAFISDNK
jgi:hypothetical protein